MRMLLTFIMFMLITSCSDAADKSRTGADVLAMSEEDQKAVVIALSEELSVTVKDEARSCIANYVENRNFTKAMLPLFENRAEEGAQITLELLFKNKCPTYWIDRKEYNSTERERTAKALEAAKKREREAEAQMDDIMERAVRLPDGRAVFSDKDGNWRFEDGSYVPKEEVKKLKQPRRK